MCFVLRLVYTWEVALPGVQAGSDFPLVEEGRQVFLL
jgi:hypothetical protein